MGSAKDIFTGVKLVSRWTIRQCSRKVHACGLLLLCLIVKSEVRYFKVLHIGFLTGKTQLFITTLNTPKY